MFGLWVKVKGTYPGLVVVVSKLGGAEAEKPRADISKTPSLVERCHRLPSIFCDSVVVP